MKALAFAVILTLVVTLSAVSLRDDASERFDKIKIPMDIWKNCSKKKKLYRTCRHQNLNECVVCWNVVHTLY